MYKQGVDVSVQLTEKPTADLTDISKLKIKMEQLEKLRQDMNKIVAQAWQTRSKCNILSERIRDCRTIYCFFLSYREYHSIGKPTQCRQISHSGIAEKLRSDPQYNPAFSSQVMGNYCDYIRSIIQRI